MNGGFEHHFLEAIQEYKVFDMPLRYVTTFL